MIAEEDIRVLKKQAARSCISCHTERAKSLGWMLGFSTSSGKHIRNSLYEHIGAVVDAVFANDARSLSSAKKALALEIKRVQPIDRFKLGPHFESDEIIAELVNQIAKNVTRFTRHLEKVIQAGEEALGSEQPKMAIDSRTLALGGHTTLLYGPGYKRIPGPRR